MTLVVFTISVIPQKIFHDLFADHKDELFATQDNSEKKIQNYQYNCGFVNVVADTPFLETRVVSKNKEYGFISYYRNFFRSVVFNITPAYFPLRGPPIA